MTDNHQVRRYLLNPHALMMVACALALSVMQTLHRHETLALYAVVDQHRQANAQLAIELSQLATSMQPSATKQGTDSYSTAIVITTPHTLPVPSSNLACATSTAQGTSATPPPDASDPMRNILDNLFGSDHPILSAGAERETLALNALSDITRNSTLSLDARLDAAIGLVEISGKPLNEEIAAQLLWAVQGSADSELLSEALEAMAGSATVDMVHLLDLMANHHDSAVSRQAYARLAELRDDPAARDIFSKHSSRNPTLVYELFDNIAMLSNY